MLRIDPARRQHIAELAHGPSKAVNIVFNLSLVILVTALITEAVIIIVVVVVVTIAING